MPNVVDFDLAAAAFSRASEGLQLLRGSSRPFLGADTVTGGALAGLVEVTMDVSDQNLTSAAAALDELADVARHRAAVCRAYAVDVQSFNHELRRWQNNVADYPTGETLPPRPRPPRSPPSWVSR